VVPSFYFAAAAAAATVMKSFELREMGEIKLNDILIDGFKL
jgi:hypothetical protein